jgi:hypothetical protein
MLQHQGAQVNGNAHKPFTLREKLMLTAGVIICYGLWYLLLRSASIPAEPGFSASLLIDQPLNALVLVAVAVPLISVLISAIVARVRPDAGLFCALAGLIYLPAHGGDLRYVLLPAKGGSVYLVLAVELAILSAIVLATPLLLTRLSRRKTGTAAPPDAARSTESMSDRLTCVGAQTICTLAILMLLGQSSMKGQALWAVGAAGLLSTLAVHHAYRVLDSRWYLAGTFLAGIVAYIYTSFRPAGMEIGDVRGLLAGAARALPLHYATAGAIGVLFGNWTIQVWHAPKPESDLLTDPAQA